MNPGDGSYPFDNDDIGWTYVRDTHGHVSNISRDDAAYICGLNPETMTFGGDGHWLDNKCFKLIPGNDNLAVYNKNGNYRLIRK